MAGKNCKQKFLHALIRIPFFFPQDEFFRIFSNIFDFRNFSQCTLYVFLYFSNSDAGNAQLKCV